MQVGIDMAVLLGGFLVVQITLLLICGLSLNLRILRNYRLIWSLFVTTVIAPLVVALGYCSMISTIHFHPVTRLVNLENRRW